MMRSLFVSATGMGAQQRQIDTVANNLANVDTVGYKKSRNNFQDLLYQIDRTAGSQSSQNTTVPVGGPSLPLTATASSASSRPKGNDFPGPATFASIRKINW